MRRDSGCGGSGFGIDLSQLVEREWRRVEEWRRFEEWRRVEERRRVAMEQFGKAVVEEGMI